MTKDEAMKQALEALVEVKGWQSLAPGYVLDEVEDAITAVRQAIEQAENNQFKPDWDAMTVMVEEQQRMASQIATITHMLKTVNSAAMKLTSDLCRMEVDDDDRVSRDRVMERVVQWRNEWDKAMSNNTSTPLYTAPPKPAQDLIVGYADVHDLTRDGHDFWVSRQPGKNTVPLYLYGHPPKIWQGLTDEAIWLEYQNLWPFHPAEEPTLAKDIAKFARSIEAKLREKNT